MIDCLDRGRFYPSTITIVRKETEEEGELQFVEYKVGFRIYPHLCPNWNEYKRHWIGTLSTDRDSKKQVYFGDNEHYDEWIPYYSKRIDKYLNLS